MAQRPRQVGVGGVGGKRVFGGRIFRHHDDICVVAVRDLASIASTISLVSRYQVLLAEIGDEFLEGDTFSLTAAKSNMAVILSGVMF